ncbi:Uncharacterised protein [Klebsiella michiganensis]|nr:hypothetical protein HMPREF9685_05647 [Klebsiella oxytoca 09-7231]CAE6320924.1 hypothetical protein AI2715V1_0664 [Escherichia coli]SBM37109.1 Uncharacterised protein [Klebsiella oxytoca]STU91383.1 Uncharacterised protein [Klebsiella michiganensis]VTM94105.1 Uncharacterised protein [Raoultella planticola]
MLLWLTDTACIKHEHVTSMHVKSISIKLTLGFVYENHAGG